MTIRKGPMYKNILTASLYCTRTGLADTHGHATCICDTAGKSPCYGFEELGSGASLRARPILSLRQASF
jgi:hypothetical protein